jgi:hypothetical protein
MGGLVSPGPVIEGEVYDEKRGMSIEVPGIVLSQPYPVALVRPS